MGYSLYLASKGNLTSLSALTFLTPIFALLFGTIILGEALSSIQSTGVLLTIVSIYLINQRKQIAVKFNKDKVDLKEVVADLENKEESLPSSLVDNITE